MDLVKSSLKIFLAKIVSSILSFSAIVIFSRELGAEPLGTYYPFIALLGILAIPADFGIRSATEKRLSEGKEDAKYLTTAIALKSAPLLITAVGIILTRSYIDQYLGANLALLLVITLFVQEIGKLSLYVLRGELRVGETALIQVLQPLGWLVIGYLLLIQGFGIEALVYGYLGGSLARLLLGWWKVSTPLARPTIQHARSLFQYGKFSMVSSVGGYFYSWMDVAILTAFVSLGIASSRSEIGAYENAWRVSLIVLMLSQAVARTIFPQISKWDREDATSQIEAVIPSAILPAVLLVIPAFVGTLILAEDILRILFGAEFAVAWLVLIILMAEKILQGIHVVLGRSLQAIDRPDLAAYATVASVAINLVLNVVLIWHFGIVGAALATAISFAVNTGLHAYYLSQFLSIKFPIREAVYAVGASTVMGFGVFAVESNVNIQSLLHLVLLVGFGAGLYGLIILSSVRIRSHILRIFPDISGRLPIF